MLIPENPTGKIVKVRWTKEYESAKSHVCVGEVRRETPYYLVLHGRTYHFGSSHSGSTRGVRTGKVRTRWIPWGQVAVVTELPADLDWQNTPFKLSQEGRLVMDDRRETPIEEM